MINTNKHPSEHQTVTSGSGPSKHCQAMVGDRPQTGLNLMLSRIKRLSHEKVLMRTKVAEATRLMESLSIHPNPIQNENVVYIGDADGKDPGHNIAAAATTASITAVASTQITAVMCDRFLSDSEKQQGTLALLACEKNLSYDLNQTELVDAHTAWLHGKLPLPVDSRGLPMWPRSNKLDRGKSSTE